MAGRDPYLPNTEKNPPQTPRPALIYEDASAPGRVCDVAVFDKNVKMANAHLSDWFLGSGGIYEFELPGALSALALANIFTPGRPIVI